MLISAFWATSLQFLKTFFLDIETFYQTLSTCLISDQLDHPNRNYKGGGAESALPRPYQSANSPACLGLKNFAKFVFVDVFAKFKYLTKEFILTRSPDHVL